MKKIASSGTYLPRSVALALPPSHAAGPCDVAAIQRPDHDFHLRKRHVFNKYIPSTYFTSFKLIFYTASFAPLYKNNRVQTVTQNTVEDIV